MISNFDRSQEVALGKVLEDTGGLFYVNFFDILASQKNPPQN